MHILFVAPYYYPEVKFGGPPKRLHAMARELIARGHSVQVVTFNSEQRSACDLRDVERVGVQYIPWLGKSLRQVPRRFRELRAEVARSEVVHCFGLYNLLCPLAARLARRAGKAFVLEPMGMFVPRVANVGIKKLYHALFTRPMAAAASRVIATSQIEYDELRSLASPAKLVLRRNGFDVSSFRTLPPGALMRARWKVPPKSSLVLYLGRISAKKNLVELVRAFALAAVPNTRLIIAGPISEPAYLQKLQAEIARSSDTAFTSVQPAVYGEDLKAALSAADLFVLPSLNENFGNSAAEAVAANVPVLLTQTCGIAPIIHGRAGLAVPLGVEALAKGLRLMCDPTTRVEWLQNPDDVKKDLAWDTPIRETEELYAAVIAESAES